MKIRHIQGEVIDARMRRYGRWKLVVFGGRELRRVFEYDPDAVLRLLAAELRREEMERQQNTWWFRLMMVGIVGAPFWFLLLGWVLSLVE